MDLNLCFHSFSHCDWFLAPFHECDENKQVDHDNKIHLFLSLTNVFHSYFIKAIDHTFYGFTGAINPPTRKACKSLA